MKSYQPDSVIMSHSFHSTASKVLQNAAAGLALAVLAEWPLNGA